MNQPRSGAKQLPASDLLEIPCFSEKLLADIIAIGKQAEILLQKVQRGRFPHHCNRVHGWPTNKAADGRGSPYLESESESSALSNDINLVSAQIDAVEIDMFDDDSLWPKAQLKQFMFTGHASAVDIAQIEQHRESIKPIYDKDSDCGVCLLEINTEICHPIYIMSCCRAKVHLECIFRCLGSRAIQNKCPSCVQSIRDDVVKEVILLMKSEKRRGKDRSSKAQIKLLGPHEAVKHEGI